MKEVAIVLVLLLVLAGGVVWWSQSGNAPAVLPAPVPSSPADNESQHAEPHSRAKSPRAAAASPGAMKKSEPVSSTSNAEAVLTQAAIVQRPETPAAPAKAPFPTVDQVARGVEADDIVERYGEPALSTTTSGHQHVVEENFVYARDRGRVQTLIHVEDGKVVSVSSEAVPAAMTAPQPLTRVRH